VKEIFLKLLSKVFELVTAIRNFAYDCGLLKSYQAQLPVICSGNIVVGGSGKSPFSQLLVKELSKLGRKPVILMRGYKGSEYGPYKVTASDGIQKVGDEALMHLFHFNNQIPIVIAKKRVDGASFIENNKLGDCIVLDDGFQHRALKKDLSFLLFDAGSSKNWEKGSLLPHGRLRENLNGALTRAQAIVFTHRGSQIKPQISQKINCQLPQFNFELNPGKILDLFNNQNLKIEDIEKSKIKAVSAIAKPHSFFNLLRDLGFEIYSHHAFPDHYKISDDEWKSIVNEETIPIITTTKDALKLKKFVTKQNQVFVLKLFATLSKQSEKQDLTKLLKTALN